METDGWFSLCVLINLAFLLPWIKKVFVFLSKFRQEVARNVEFLYGISSYKLDKIILKD